MWLGFLLLIALVFNRTVAANGYCGIESPNKPSLVEAVKNDGDASELSFSDWFSNG